MTSNNIDNDELDEFLINCVLDIQRNIQNNILFNFELKQEHINLITEVIFKNNLSFNNFKKFYNELINNEFKIENSLNIDILLKLEEMKNLKKTIIDTIEKDLKITLSSETINTIKNEILKNFFIKIKNHYKKEKNPYLLYNKGNFSVDLDRKLKTVTVDELNKIVLNNNFSLNNLNKIIDESLYNNLKDMLNYMENIILKINNSKNIEDNKFINIDKNTFKQKIENNRSEENKTNIKAEL